MNFVNGFALMAAQASSGGGGGQQFIFIMIAMMVMFYFLILRPNQSEKKQRQKMIDELKTDDRVITIGGIHGIVREIKKSKGTVIIEVGKNTRLEVNRTAVHNVNPKHKESDEKE